MEVELKALRKPSSTHDPRIHVGLADGENVNSTGLDRSMNSRCGTLVLTTKPPIQRQLAVLLQTEP